METVYNFVVDESHIVVPALLLSSWYGVMVRMALSKPARIA